MIEINDLAAVLFDLDGTVYLGESVLPGAVELIRALRKRNIKTLFISNKPLYPRQVYAEKLTRLGIPTAKDKVLTSAYVLGRYLAKHAPLLNYYVIGEENLRAELRQYGLIVLDELYSQNPQEVIDPSGIDAVIVAFDRTLDYRKLNTAFQALKKGARFFATNSDKVCPMPNGAIPDAGAIIAYLEHISGRKVELLAGKPSELIVEVALEKLNISPERCVMIGDRLETDIRMGNHAGMKTVLVLSGITTRDMVRESADQPNMIVENLFDFGKNLRILE
ncbi:MAG: HAD-IIA family hydrolase [Anaerolineales bacterium]